MNRAIAAKKENKFQVSVDYLAEYGGVKGAVIADPEGLVIAQSGSPEFQAELYAAMSLVLAGAIEGHLSRLVEPGIEYLVIKTSDTWITIAGSSTFYLVIAAERQADELLNIRISRAYEMITSYMKEKYSGTIPKSQSRPEHRTKSMEEIHV